MQKAGIIILAMAMAACATHRIEVVDVQARSETPEDGVSITASVAAGVEVDSLVVYPEPDTRREVYFTYRMQPIGGGQYAVDVPKFRRGMPYNRELTPHPVLQPGENFRDAFRYNIVAYKNGRPTTYPGAKKGLPSSHRHTDYYIIDFSK